MNNIGSVAWNVDIVLEMGTVCMECGHCTWKHVT